MPSPFARLARRLAGPGTPTASRPRTGVLVPPSSRPRPGAPLLWALLAAVAPCCLAAALSQAATFSVTRGPDAAGPMEAAAVEEVEDQCRALVRRSVEKQRLAGEVIAGRLSLLEAATRFRHLDKRQPVVPRQSLRRAYPGASDDELSCRAVLQYVGVEVGRQPGADPAVVGRLEADLGDLLRHGDLRLPRPDDVRPGAGEGRHPPSAPAPPS